jgi:HK97 gp10 family phage protein
VSVITVEAWVNQLVRQPGEMRKEASKVVREAAFLCQRIAIQRAPVDTGFLRESITVGGVQGGQVRSGLLSLQVGPEAAYGAFVEFGTTKAGAQPYMTPAAEQAGEWFTEAMRTRVGLQ